MVDASSTQNVLTIRRTIKAPRQNVFDAWTKPEHLKNWWRANPSWQTEIAEVDLRVGGKYRLGMRDPDQDGPFVCQGEFLEVTPPEKLVYSWSWDAPAMDVGETLVTVEFIEMGKETELILTHERFPDSEAAAKHTEGWNGCIGNFVKLFQAE